MAPPADVTSHSRPRPAAFESPLSRRLVAEGLGTAALTMAVVGSATMGHQLAPEQPGLTLLADALVTAALLFVLIQVFDESGGHFNPLVSAVLALRGRLRHGRAIAYMGSQVAGALAGVGLSDAMFGIRPYTLSHVIHDGIPQWLSEFVATLGLVGVVLRCLSKPSDKAAGCVACYVGSAFWFTGTGFVNPAVNIARCLTGTSAGIRALDLPALLACEALATALAAGLAGWLRRR